MKKLRLTRLLAVILAVIMVLPLFVACKKDKYDNEKDQLVVALEEPDGVFNSFFATSGNDTTVAGTVAAGMISMDKNAKIVFGPEHPSVALDFMQKITYDPNNPNATTVIDGVSYTDYYFVLKNKVKFSDGTPLTIKDVLFTYYVYLDTSYIGSSTMYSTDIVGLDAYRTQTEDENAQENLDYQMLRSAAARRDSLIEAYKDIRKNEYNDNLVAAGLKDQISYTLDDAGVRHYTLTSAMRDKIREQYPAVEGSETSMGVDLAADYEYVARTFYEELESDYSNNMGSWDTDDLRDLILNDTQMFLYAEGFISDELNDQGQYRPPQNHQYRDWTDADKQKAINLVFENKMPNEFETILTAWGTAMTALEQFKAEAYTFYLNSNKGTVPNIKGITWNKQWLADDPASVYVDESMIPDSTILDKEAKTITITNDEAVTTTYPLAEYDAHGNLVSGFEVVKIRIHEVDPKAVYNFSITPMPMHIYSNQEQVEAWDGLQNFGVKMGNIKFMTDMRKITIPVGAGAYQASNIDGTVTGSGLKFEDFYTGTSVYFVRNEYFYTLFSGWDSATQSEIFKKRDMSKPDEFAYVTCSEEDAKSNNAKIKRYHYYVINSMRMWSTLQAGSVHYASPSAKKDTINDLNQSENRKKFGYVRVDNLGYGYIGINAGQPGLENVHVRRAIAHSIDLQLFLNYYPGGLAEIIYRSMSAVSWAYPEGLTEAYYPYDSTSTRSKIREELELAVADGYLTNVNNAYYYKGKPLKLTFTISGDTQDHPAYQVLYNAAEILNNTFGTDITVKTDISALRKLATGSLQVWAAAWSSTVDPDMYQVYHKGSVATSVWNWGYREIWADTTTAQNMYSFEREVIDRLSERIENARTMLEQDARAAIYELALEDVMELCVEIPTYQRKNLFAFNKNIIDENSLLLSEDSNSVKQVTPYQDPMSRIWEVSFVNQD